MAYTKNFLLLARLLLFVLHLMLANSHIHAQAKPPEIREVLPEKGIYRFPAFQQGSIFFRDGTVATALLNFNVSLGEMHFITQKGDTLAVADPATLHFINVHNSRFYFNKGYLESIDSIASCGIILAFKQILAAQQQRKAGAYGMAQPHEGVRTVTFYGDNGRPYVLEDDDKITVTARELYFFGDSYGNFVKTSKEFIYDHFQKHHAVLKAFMAAHRINFNNYEDLKKLMEFCRTLP